MLAVPSVFIRVLSVKGLSWIARLWLAYIYGAGEIAHTCYVEGYQTLTLLEYWTYLKMLVERTRCNVLEADPARVVSWS